MTTPPVVPLGLSAAGKESVQLAAMMNRHGLVAGATGTGKTVTLQVLAEGLSQIGVPVFTADIKGDLIKELERHAATLGALRSNPGVNQLTLENTLSRLDPVLSALRSPACQPGQRMRQLELVTQVRQRLAIPGGLCSFDLPAFHFWLSREHPVRVAQLNDESACRRVGEERIDG
jgi:cell division FtsZ-interacting protein ZapD